MPTKSAARIANKLPRLAKTRCVDAVRRFTRKLFQSPVKVRLDFDPEFSARYFVVTVMAKGSMKELLSLDDKWHQDIGEIAGDYADQFRLSLRPHES